jgi:hypothetical protein
MSLRIKLLWIIALRQYQGKVAKYGMRYHNTYDALGVLCNLATKELHKLDWECCNFNAGYYKIDNHYSNLPDQVKIWADLTCNSPKISYKGIITPIHRLSDQGLSLSVIADLIEEQL